MAGICLIEWNLIILFKFLIVFLLAYVMFGLIKPKKEKRKIDVEDAIPEDEDKVIDDKNAIDVNICPKCNTYIAKGERHKCN